MFSYSPSSSGYAVISLDCFDNLSLMVRSRALSKERVFYCIYKIDSFRAIVCKTYLFTGSLSVFELFFLLQRSTWRKHSQTPGRSFLQRQKKTENEWKVKQYATAAHLSISNISTTSPVSCLSTDTLGFPSSYMSFSSVFVGLPHFSLHSKTKWITASEDRWQFCQICDHHLLHFSEVYFVFC